MEDMVSVIIPTYNACSYVANAIESLLSQDYSDYEVIVVDDGSTDQTKQVLKRYEGRIRYVYQDHAGAAKARNTGIRLSKGKYIAFLDADDLWLPGKLKKQIDFSNRHPQYSLIFTDMQHVVENSTICHSYLKERNYQYVSSGSIYENLLRECFIFTPTVMVRRECLREVGLFNEDLEVSEDYDLWLRIADRFEIGFLDEPLVIRKRHENNLTKDRYLYITCGLRVMKQLYERNRTNKRREKIIKKQLGKRYFDLGYYLFELGQQGEARHNFLKNFVYSACRIRALFYIAICFLHPSVIDYVRTAKRRLSGWTNKAESSNNLLTCRRSAIHD